MARLVAPGLPHHVTQRGTRRERVFFEDDDDRANLALISAAARRSGTEVCACCLRPNPVHFIMTPTVEDGLRQTFAEARRRYTGRINARSHQSGHLRQGRFGGVVMDEHHLLAAMTKFDDQPRAGRLDRNVRQKLRHSRARRLVDQDRDDGARVERVAQGAGSS